jgi:ribosome-associated heat shock protein Hsp15
MPPPQNVRIDKWLWAVRLYKSRSLATEACAAGHVKISGGTVKPSREVRLGDVITAFTAGKIHRTIRVLALLDQRVGAQVVPQFLEDLTPPEEYARAREEALQTAVRFPQGFVRPTKKQRRQLERFLDPQA